MDNREIFSDNKPVERKEFHQEVKKFIVFHLLVNFKLIFAMCEKGYNDIVVILFSLKERTLAVLNTMNEHSQLGKECRTLLHTKTSVFFLDYIAN